MKLVTVLSFFAFISSAAMAESVTLNCADLDGLSYNFYASSESPSISIMMVSDVGTWGKTDVFGKKIQGTAVESVSQVFFPVDKNKKSGMRFTFSVADKDLKIANAKDLIEGTKNVKEGIDQVVKTFSVYAGGVAIDGNMMTGGFASCYLHRSK